MKKIFLITFIFYFVLFIFFYNIEPWGSIFGFSYFTTHDGTQYFKVGLDPTSKIPIAESFRYIRIGLPWISNTVGKFTANLEILLGGRNYCKIQGMTETFPLYIWWMSFYLILFNMLGLFGSLYEWHRFSTYKWNTKLAFNTSIIWTLHPILLICAFSTLTSPIETYISFLFLRMWRENKPLTIQIIIGTIGIFVKESMMLLLISKIIWEIYNSKHNIKKKLLNITFISIGITTFIAYILWASYFDDREYNALKSYNSFRLGSMGLPFIGYFKTTLFQFERLYNSTNIISSLGIILRLLSIYLLLYTFCFGIWLNKNLFETPEFIYGILISIITICSTFAITRDFDNIGRIVCPSLAGYIYLVTICNKKKIVLYITNLFIILLTLNFIWFIYKLKIYGDYTKSLFPYPITNINWWDYFKL